MIFYQKKLLSKDNITKSKNNYNPLINPVILLVCFLFVILVEITPFSKQINKQILGTTVNLQSEKIIELTNEQRQKNGLSVLKANDKLAQAALAKANDMFQFEYWDHFSPSKRSPWTFILNAGYDYHYAGENLAKDF
ncbi:hypothetical protein GYA19_03135, partial [Candidatus Beckwithbacteria bacterium]|nr:hypothetical protein [Candidatus Beckwithbacteria bacterium]